MSKRTMVACGLAGVLGMSMAATADPPARPRALTAAQQQYLTQLQQQPEHMAVRQVQATYTSETCETSDQYAPSKFIRASDDFWTIAYQAGLPGTILGLLICAAPL
jgi:hypothetical protein